MSKAKCVRVNGPGGIARQQDMIAALKRDKPGVGNAAGNHPALLEWYGGIIAAMKHERRRGDVRPIVDNVDVSEEPQQTGRIRGRSGESL